MQCFEDFSQIITLEEAHKKNGKKLSPKDLSIKNNCSIVFNDNEILWIGNKIQKPDEYKNIPTKSFEGHILLPEIVDSHTHLVFGGNRAKEYSMRLNGADYQAIAESGGGILSTMENTITASADELFELGKERVERIYSFGVGSIEIKSGYGLTIESERKISKVIHRLKQHFKGKVQIFNTYLAAHAVPGGYSGSHEYLERVVNPLLEELAKENIIDFVDIFHEEGYFNINDTKELFDLCKRLNLPTKIHADEFNDNGGAKVAVEYNSLSADHLLCTGDEGLSALAHSDTVATLLPGTAFFLGKPLADARKFLDAGCKVALASDYNPGSSHCDNLLLLASISAKNLQMNLCELWASITLNAAHAVNQKNQGALIKGLKPRFSIFKCNSVDEITYSWGQNFSINSL